MDLLPGSSHLVDGFTEPPGLLLIISPLGLGVNSLPHSKHTCPSCIPLEISRPQRVANVSTAGMSPENFIMIASGPPLLTPTIAQYCPVAKVAYHPGLPNTTDRLMLTQHTWTGCHPS